MILFADESHRIMGVCFEVYKIKGPGFLEPVYQECLEMEFELRKIPFTPHTKLVLTYKDKALKHRYQPDFVLRADHPRDQSGIATQRRTSRPGSQLSEEHGISAGTPGQLLSPPSAGT